MSQERRAVFVHGPELEKLGYPHDCPFNTKRAGMTRRTINQMGFLSAPNVREHNPSPANRTQLERFHKKEYIDALIKASEGKLDPEAFLMGIGTPDCPVFPDIFTYPALGCGATLDAANILLNNEADVVFNPSGGFHHAGPATAAGFCFLNDIVLACMTIADAGKKVCFLDIDVHHCDGVQDAFHERDDIMTISMHESGRTLFPGTGNVEDIGTGKGKGFSVNLPLPVGTHDKAYVEAFKEAIIPLLGAYSPDIIVMELGMDALAGDPLAHLRLTNNAHADVLELVLELNKPLLATGGGGYNPENTSRGWALAWTIMAEFSDHVDEMSFGLGGVMLASTEWQGGLRDRALSLEDNQDITIGREIRNVVESLKKIVFPIHGI